MPGGKNKKGPNIEHGGLAGFFNDITKVIPSDKDKSLESDLLVMENDLVDKINELNAFLKTKSPDEQEIFAEEIAKLQADYKEFEGIIDWVEKHSSIQEVDFDKISSLYLDIVTTQDIIVNGVDYEKVTSDPVLAEEYHTGMAFKDTEGKRIPLSQIRNKVKEDLLRVSGLELIPETFLESYSQISTAIANLNSEKKNKKEAGEDVKEFNLKINELYKELGEMVGKYIKDPQSLIDLAESDRKKKVSTSKSVEGIVTDQNHSTDTQNEAGDANLNKKETVPSEKDRIIEYFNRWKDGDVSLFNEGWENNLDDIESDLNRILFLAGYDKADRSKLKKWIDRVEETKKNNEANRSRELASERKYILSLISSLLKDKDLNTDLLEEQELGIDKINLDNLHPASLESIKELEERLFSKLENLEAKLQGLDDEAVSQVLGVIRESLEKSRDFVSDEVGEEKNTKKAYLKIAIKAFKSNEQQLAQALASNTHEENTKSDDVETEQEVLNKLRESAQEKFSHIQSLFENQTEELKKALQQQFNALSQDYKTYIEASDKGFPYYNDITGQVVLGRGDLESVREDFFAGVDNLESSIKSVKEFSGKDVESESQNNQELVNEIVTNAKSMHEKMRNLVWEASEKEMRGVGRNMILAQELFEDILSYQRKDSVNSDDVDSLINIFGEFELYFEDLKTHLGILSPEEQELKYKANLVKQEFEKWQNADNELLPMDDLDWLRNLRKIKEDLRMLLLVADYPEDEVNLMFDENFTGWVQELAQARTLKSAKKWVAVKKIRWDILSYVSEKLHGKKLNETKLRVLQVEMKRREEEDEQKTSVTTGNNETFNPNEEIEKALSGVDLHPSSIEGFDESLQKLENIVDGLEKTLGPLGDENVIMELGYIREFINIARNHAEGDKNSELNLKRSYLKRIKRKIFLLTKANYFVASTAEIDVLDDAKTSPEPKTLNKSPNPEPKDPTPAPADPFTTPVPAPINPGELHMDADKREAWKKRNEAKELSKSLKVEYLAKLGEYYRNRNLKQKALDIKGEYGNNSEYIPREIQEILERSNQAADAYLQLLNERSALRSDNSEDGFVARSVNKALGAGYKEERKTIDQAKAEQVAENADATYNRVLKSVMETVRENKKPLRYIGLGITAAVGYTGAGLVGMGANMMRWGIGTFGGAVIAEAVYRRAQKKVDDAERNLEAKIENSGLSTSTSVNERRRLLRKVEAQVGSSKLRQKGLAFGTALLIGGTNRVGFAIADNLGLIHSDSVFANKATQSIEVNNTTRVLEVPFTGERGPEDSNFGVKEKIIVPVYSEPSDGTNLAEKTDVPANEVLLANSDEVKLKDLVEGKIRNYTLNDIKIGVDNYGLTSDQKELLLRDIKKAFDETVSTNPKIVNNLDELNRQINIELNKMELWKNEGLKPVSIGDVKENITPASAMVLGEQEQGGATFGVAGQSTPETTTETLSKENQAPSETPARSPNEIILNPEEIFKHDEKITAHGVDEVVRNYTLKDVKLVLGNTDITPEQKDFLLSKVFSQAEAILAEKPNTSVDRLNIQIYENLSKGPLASTDLWQTADLKEIQISELVQNETSSNPAVTTPVENVMTQSPSEDVIGQNDAKHFGTTESVTENNPSLIDKNLNYTIKPGDNTLSQVLLKHLNDQFDNGNLKLPEGYSKENLGAWMYKKFPELTTRDYTSTTINWEDYGVKGGNPHLIKLDQRLKIGELMAKMEEIELKPAQTGSLNINQAEASPKAVPDNNAPKEVFAKNEADEIVNARAEREVASTQLANDTYNQLLKNLNVAEAEAGRSDLSFESPKGNSLTSDHYQKIINEEIGGRSAFNREILHQVDVLEAKQKGGILSFFEAPHRSPYQVKFVDIGKSLGEMKLSEIAQMRAESPISDLASRNGFKPEVLQTWFTEVDRLTAKQSGLPSSPTTTFSDLFGRNVAEKLHEANMKTNLYTQ